VKRAFRRRLARFDRYRQRVVEKGFPVATPHWEDVPGFDAAQHLHHIALPAPHDRRALAELVSDLASTPLDRARPLWDAHVVDDVEGGSALILRAHHCIGDGTAMMLVCRELFDESPAPIEDDDDDPPPQVAAEVLPSTDAEEPPPRRTGEATSTSTLIAPVVGVLQASARYATRAAAVAWKVASRPEPLVAKAKLALDGAGMLVGELFKSPDPPSPLKGAFGVEKRVAWSAPVSLADARAIGAPVGAKINDVLVAAMSGALRTYLKNRGVRRNRIRARAMVPVDLRPPGRAPELGNAFGLVLLDLPLDSDRSRERLARTKRRMDALKHSAEPIAILALFDLIGRLPKAVEDFAVDLFGSKASLVMTNVAGPREPIHLAGARIERLLFCVPHPGRQLGMGISIMSYHGAATLTVVADAHLVPDPESITDAFDREFARMARNARRQHAKEAPAKQPGARPREDAGARKGKQTAPTREAPAVNLSKSRRRRSPHASAE
jgi:WS/DGAT/MGAT family acyltransferase